MKTASGLHRPTGKRVPAWLCVVINLFAFPGLGTVLAGRRGGYLQAIIMVAGFVLVVGYLLLYIGVAMHYMINGTWTEAEFHAKYRPYLWALYDGLGLCLVAWVWALWSSVILWRKRNKVESN
jgi:hypothetical protein